MGTGMWTAWTPPLNKAKRIKLSGTKGSGFEAKEFSGRKQGLIKLKWWKGRVLTSSLLFWTGVSWTGNLWRSNVVFLGGGAGPRKHEDGPGCGRGLLAKVL